MSAMPLHSVKCFLALMQVTTFLFLVSIYCMQLVSMNLVKTPPLQKLPVLDAESLSIYDRDHCSQPASESVKSRIESY